MRRELLADHRRDGAAAPRKVRSMEADELKQEVAKVDGRRGHKYPEQLRDAARALSHRNKSLGKRPRQTAEELGMSVQTLSYWRALERDRRSKMTRVAFIDDESRSADTLVVEYDRCP